MSFSKRFFLRVGLGILGFYTASYLLPEVSYDNYYSLFLAGGALGFVNFFVRPALKLITLPLRILTLGLFTFFINTAIVWFIQNLFEGIVITGSTALLQTTFIIWFFEFVTYILLRK